MLTKFHKVLKKADKQHVIEHYKVHLQQMAFRIATFCLTIS